jgi:GntR family transcriptional regulator
LRIIITNTSGKPIYEQIEEQIKEAILSDELREGDLLPSIRQLARDLKISVITTTRAYDDLECEGFISIVQGKGCYVLPKNSELIREQLLRRIEESLSAAIGAARSAKLSRNELIKMLDMILEENSDE